MKEYKVWVESIKKMKKMIEVNFDCKMNFNKKDLKEFIVKSVKGILQILENKNKNFYVSILLTNNEKIRKINSQYRNVDKETNVLSFAQNEERMLYELRKYFILGDIVISIEKILSEAEQQQKKFWDHLLHMLTHSILHLFGYDHQNDLEAKKMYKKEKDILMKFIKRY